MLMFWAENGGKACLNKFYLETLKSHPDYGLLGDFLWFVDALWIRRSVCTVVRKLVAPRERGVDVIPCKVNNYTVAHGSL